MAKIFFFTIMLNSILLNATQVLVHNLTSYPIKLKLLNNQQFIESQQKKMVDILSVEGTIYFSNNPIYESSHFMKDKGIFKQELPEYFTYSYDRVAIILCENKEVEINFLATTYE